MFTELFNSFKDLNILIIGDVMIDAYLWGKVDRISPEAPVPIVSVHQKESRLGGAANVALNIKALAARPIICAVVGDDLEGEIFLNLIKNENIDADGILQIPNRQTTVKTRVIGNNQQILRVDAETELEITKEQSELLLQRISKIINKQPIHAIIFEDYDKGLITPFLIDEVTKEAKSKNIPIVVDPKKKNFLSYHQVDVFKPNLKELKEGLKVDFNPRNHIELKNTVKQLQDKIQAKSILLTLSEHGVYAMNQEQEILSPAHIRNVADVSGAGDTVISVVATCIAAGLDVFTAAKLGNLAGGLVCEKVGVVPVDKELLLKEALKLE
ncbi:bifunctional ADP-heptose synthase [Pelobium sp.]|nr:bifunctional ADP-heptose synthase [Pelobium sp.]MDA9554882.1 bifunctional ADP-heptose synthase [Pelobium sp.]